MNIYSVCVNAKTSTGNFKSVWIYTYRVYRNHSVRFPAPPSPIAMGRYPGKSRLSEIGFAESNCADCITLRLAEPNMQDVARISCKIAGFVPSKTEQN